MARIRARVEVKLDGLKKIRQVLRRPFAEGRGRAGANAIKSLIVEQELGGGGGFTASGSFAPFQPSRPFGNRPATVPPLGGSSGAVARAWQAAAISTANNRLAITAIAPFLIVHRGGKRLPKRTITAIRAKRRDSDGRLRMQKLLAARYGVFISEATLLGPGLQVPSRPHADPRSPQMREAVAAPIQQAIREVGR